MLGKIRWLKRFAKAENGSATIETVIMLPIFVWLLVFIVNASMIFFQKNEAFRIIQNANRILSTGYMQTTEQVETFIANALSDIAPDAIVSTNLNSGVVSSTVEYTVSNLLMPWVVEDITDVRIRIQSQHFMEY